MLAIRMQRTGRKGYASFRIVVQDTRFTPKSGRVVAQLGNYNPHTKEVVIDKSKAEQYLSVGAQPTPRVVSLLAAQKVTLPDWVRKAQKDKKSAIKNSDKLRKNQPKEETVVEEPVVAETAEATEPAPAEEPAA